LRSTKQATEVLRRVRWSYRQSLFHERSNRLGSRSDRQPLFRGRSNRLGSRSDHQPMFRAWSDHPDVQSDRQQRQAVESPVEHRAPVVVRAWKSHRESSCRKMSKLLVRRGEAEKEKLTSSKTTYQEMIMLLVVRSRHR
jgi:hypothetical protein